MATKSNVFVYQVGDEVLEATGETLKYFENWKSEIAAREAAEVTKIAARQSALAKLAELGLTEAEIAAL